MPCTFALIVAAVALLAATGTLVYAVRLRRQRDAWERIVGGLWDQDDSMTR